MSSALLVNGEAEIFPTCGCKGARYCDLCQSTERVKNLKFSDAGKTPDELLENYQRLIFCIQCQNSYPTSSEVNLSDFDHLFDICCNFHETHEATTSSNVEINLDSIIVVPDFINCDEEQELVEKIDSVEWVLSQSGRRKQDYGPKVNFKKQKVKFDSWLGMPNYADLLLERMKNSSDKLRDYIPFEMCNLEYSPERGSFIDFHCDDTWIWGNRLISINLLAGSIMILKHEESQKLLLIPMPRKSLLCMADNIRYNWKHGIIKSHIVERRIALTMREPSCLFLPSGDLYEKYGKEAIRLSQERVVI